MPGSVSCARAIMKLARSRNILTAPNSFATTTATNTCPKPNAEIWRIHIYELGGVTSSPFATHFTAIRLELAPHQKRTEPRHNPFFTLKRGGGAGSLPPNLKGMPRPPCSSVLVFFHCLGFWCLAVCRLTCGSLPLFSLSYSVVT